MITRRKFLATSAMGLWLPTAFGASPVMTRRVVLSRTESAPDMLWQTTKVGVFNPTITKTGLPVEWDYGDGSALELTNAPSHTYAATGIKNVGIRLQDMASKVSQIVFNQKSLVGTIPDIKRFINVSVFGCYGNVLTGNAPNINNLPLLTSLHISQNSLTGNSPVWTFNPLLTSIWIDNNLFVGTMSSFTQLTALTEIYGNNNLLTGYITSTISLTLTTFVMTGNRVPQSDIDQIAADFATNIASRPATGTLNVGGTGNAAPSATGLSNFNLVAAHGFTVTHN